MVRDRAIRTLTDEGRLHAVKYCFFSSRSPIWTTELRAELVGLIQRGRDDQLIYTNVRDFLDLIIHDLDRGIDGIGPRKSPRCFRTRNLFVVSGRQSRRGRFSIESKLRSYELASP
jgi:hypothetical protein